MKNESNYSIEEIDNDVVYSKFWKKMKGNIQWRKDTMWKVMTYKMLMKKMKSNGIMWIIMKSIESMIISI